MTGVHPDGPAVLLQHNKSIILNCTMASPVLKKKGLSMLKSQNQKSNTCDIL